METTSITSLAKPDHPFSCTTVAQSCLLLSYKAGFGEILRYIQMEARKCVSIKNFLNSCHIIHVMIQLNRQCLSHCIGEELSTRHLGLGLVQTQLVVLHLINAILYIILRI